MSNADQSEPSIINRSFRLPYCTITLTLVDLGGGVHSLSAQLSDLQKEKFRTMIANHGAAESMRVELRATADQEIIELIRKKFPDRGFKRPDKFLDKLWPKLYLAMQPSSTSVRVPAGAEIIQFT